MLKKDVDDSKINNLDNSLNVNANNSKKPKKLVLLGMICIAIITLLILSLAAVKIIKYLNKPQIPIEVFDNGTTSEDNLTPLPNNTVNTTPNKTIITQTGSSSGSSSGSGRKPPCVPDCSGKTCGSDGCRGICGTCDASSNCFENNCIPKVYANNITQFGITWYFDRPYEYGTFANGDYWVVGPVNIINVTPEWDGQKNGAMLDPVPGAAQGYDSRSGWYQYNDSSRIKFPATINAIQTPKSLISSVGLSSCVTGGAYECLSTAAVLTIVNSSLPAGSLRPAYANGSKNIYNINQIKWNLLPKFPYPTNASVASAIQSYLQDERMGKRVWLDHGPLGQASGIMRPSSNMVAYPAYHTLMYVSPLSLLVMIDMPQRENMTIRLIQAGIDNYGVSEKQNHYFRSMGGFGIGRKWPIIFAGIMLDDNQMKNPPLTINSSYLGYRTDYKFGEDGHTYSGQATADWPEGKPLFGQICNTNYFTAYCAWSECVDSCMTEHNNLTICEGSGHCGTSPSGDKDCRDPAGLKDECVGYFTVNGPSWIGQGLSARLMNATVLWNNTAYFLMVDRWANNKSLWPYQGTQHPDLYGYGGLLSQYMWNNYRGEHCHNNFCNATAGENAQNCPDDCSAPSCTNDTGCSAVGSFCSGNMPYTCTRGSDGCLDRVNANSCLIGQICSSGNCVATPIQSNSMIINHTAVAMFDQIPIYYINEVKKMSLYYPGESHSSGLPIGFRLINDSRYTVGFTSVKSDKYLRVITGGRGEEDTWTDPSAVVSLNNYLKANNFSAFAFGWCWDMTSPGPSGGIDPVYQTRWAGRSYNLSNTDQGIWGLDLQDTALTGNLGGYNMNNYTETWDFYQRNNPNTTIIYSTGPGEGGGESGYQRWLKHEYIRSWVRQNKSRALFDYDDILCYNNSEALATASWTDYGGVSHIFPVRHIQNTNAYNLNGSTFEDGDHIGQFGAIRLAKAMWVLMAMKSGWDGTPKCALNSDCVGNPNGNVCDTTNEICVAQLGSLSISSTSTTTFDKVVGFFKSIFGITGKSIEAITGKFVFWK